MSWESAPRPVNRAHSHPVVTKTYYHYTAPVHGSILDTMAMPYPEGEVFFDRKVLKSSNPKVYDANDISKFYSHLMIEYIWNEETYHGSPANGWNEDTATVPDDWKHPRTSYQVVRAFNWDTFYGVYTNLPFSYGNTPGNILKRHQHELDTNAADFVNREKGVAAEVRLPEHLQAEEQFELLTRNTVQFHVHSDAHHGRKMDLDGCKLHSEVFLSIRTGYLCLYRTVNCSRSGDLYPRGSLR